MSVSLNSSGQMAIAEGSREKKTVMENKRENELSLGRSKGEIWLEKAYTLA